LLNIHAKVFFYDLTLSHDTSVTDDDEKKSDRRQTTDDNRTISWTVT